MRHNNLRDYIKLLEQRKELIRIKQTVSRDLEITEIADRVSKMSDGGSALLFESVEGCDMPVLINAFGSWNRMAWALGLEDFSRIERHIGSILDEDVLLKGSFSQKIGLAKELAQLTRILPKVVKKAPCQEIVLNEKEVDLNKIPILKCWPDDAGRFITFPMVITKDPLNQKRNVGMYRMQVIDSHRTFMHWQTQKDAAIHSRTAMSKGEVLPVSVAIGADPASVYSAVAPLPYGVDEFMFSGFLRRKGVDLVKCVTNDLEVPAEAEIVLEGELIPSDEGIEGPFGDHTGVYTPPEPFPIFRVKCITMRKNPIYHTTIVGLPPMEDYYMGKAIERSFLPILKKQLPELVDMNFPMEGTFNNAVIVSIKKQFPYHARKVAHAMWGLGQLSYTKVVVVVEDSIDVHDISKVALTVFNNIDPKRDLFFVEGPVDTLNHATNTKDFGSKLGIDATVKWADEGYQRQWPQEIQMDQATIDKVSERWSEYGLGDAKK